MKKKLRGKPVKIKMNNSTRQKIAKIYIFCGKFVKLFYKTSSKFDEFFDGFNCPRKVRQIKR